MPALTRNKKKAATKSPTPPTKQVTNSKAPPSKIQKKPQTSTSKKGAKSQNKPPLKKQKKEVVEEEPLEDDEDDVSTDEESEELDESDDGEKGSNALFSDDDDEEEENDDDEETLGDDFLVGSGDEDEEGPSDADSDSDDNDIVRKSDAIDRQLAKDKKDAAAEVRDNIKQDGPDEELEHDAFRLPTEEVTFFMCNILCLALVLAISNCCYYPSLSRSLQKKLVVHQIFLYLRVELKRVSIIPKFIALLLLNVGVMVIVLDLTSNG